uniref:Uncharacterized protein n=1 Tax=Arundo donax TaxID=35708 RepID=A0A0A9TI84_ARUDO
MQTRKFVSNFVTQQTISLTIEDTPKNFYF